MRATIPTTRFEQCMKIMFFLLLTPVLLAVLAIWLVLYTLFRVCLHVAIWTLWCGTGRDILFVYSDSPVWHEYIEQNILTRLGRRAVVLNWSERRNWPFSLGRAAFRHFGGRLEFNPLAVVFQPFRPTRVFRFWRPFMDLKHGHPEALREMESSFFALISVDNHS